MRLSVIIPTYNEAKTLPDILEKVLSAPPPDKEVILIDDGSTDSTLDVLEPYRHRNRFKILEQRTNQGKGMAVRTAIPHLIGDCTLIQDADLELDPQALLFPFQTAPLLLTFGTACPRSRLQA